MDRRERSHGEERLGFWAGPFCLVDVIKADVSDSFYRGLYCSWVHWGQVPRTG